MGDCFEALLAAIFKDHGLEVTTTWLRERIHEAYDLQDRSQFVNWAGEFSEGLKCCVVIPIV
jgi:dsRNA-specific ribonuclease